MSGFNYLRFLRKCQSKNYKINLIYFWLYSPELAIARVRQRVASGGHNIPEDTIIRRYHRGRKNLIESYIPLCDTWIIYNNSSFPPELVATYNQQSKITLYSQEIWQKIHMS